MNRCGARRRQIRAQRVYRLIVLLYPAAHRASFGRQMVQAFGDRYRDEVSRPDHRRVRFWLAVLADAGASLLTEHAAGVRARARRMARTVKPRRRARRGRARRGGGEGCGMSCGMNRQRRVRRRLRYRRSADRRPRVLVRNRHHRLVHRGRIAALAGMVALVGAALGAGAATGHLGIAALVAGLVAAAWLGYAIRLRRPVPAGPRGDGPAPPGGAGVREPRRPLPTAPAGSAVRARLDQDPPGQAVALL
jgi:hypothetical protein